jgi:ribosomal-protein-alanine N-acetyltransferase
MNEAIRTLAAPSLSTRLETDRLVLRPPRSSDVGRVRQALRENDAHLRPWSAAPAHGEDPASLTAVSRTILRERSEWKLGQTFALLVLTRADESLVVGRVALGGVHRGAFQNAYLGYWIDSRHQRRGLMTEAVVATTAFAFSRANLHRVQAAVTPGNRASQRVLEKAGYRQEGLARRYLCIAGRWDDHLLYAMTVEEWSAAREA